jgi:hypothetical protein
VKRLLILALGVALTAAACGTSASDSDVSLNPSAGATAGASAKPQTSAAKTTPASPVYREVTIPAGTSLPLRLTTAVASDTSRVEDPISAELTNPVMIDGREVLPAGAKVTGVVATADGAGRVKGRAQVALLFTSVSGGGTQRYGINTELFSRQASATKGEDATKIGIGAGAGAAIGAILGGKKGAAEGAAVGGGAGTGVVLATKGDEVRLASGADVTTRLTAPLTVRVRVTN